MLPYYYWVFTYFASFTYYEDDIIEVISNFHIQGVKIGGKKNKFGRKSFKKLNFAEFMEFIFSKSDIKEIMISKIWYYISLYSYGILLQVIMWRKKIYSHTGATHKWLED